MNILIYILALILLGFIFYNKSIEKYESIATDHDMAISSWDLLDPIKFTGDCYKQSGSKCLQYRNCGLSNNKCIPGDKDGPYYNSTSDKWIYRDNITNKIRVVSPYNKMIKCGIFQNNNFVGI